MAGVYLAVFKWLKLYMFRRKPPKKLGKIAYLFKTVYFSVNKLIIDWLIVNKFKRSGRHTIMII